MSDVVKCRFCQEMVFINAALYDSYEILELDICDKCAELEVEEEE